MKIRDFIVTLQSLPETKKKIILIAVVAFFAIVLGFFWVQSAKSHILGMVTSLKSVNFSGLIPAQDASGNLPNVTDVINGSNAQVVSNVLQNISQQQNPDWKTYTNATYGFEIQYPSDWPLPVQNDSKNTVNFNGKVLMTYYKNTSDLPDNKNNLSLSQWLSQNNSSYLKKDTMAHVVIGENYPAITMKEKYCNQVPVLVTMYVAQNSQGANDVTGGPVYQIEGPLFACDDKNISQEYENAQNTFNEMIKTFTFTGITK